MTDVLTLKDYSLLIDLRSKTYHRSTNQIDYAALVHQIFIHLQGAVDTRAKYSVNEERTMIHSILTIRDPSLVEHRLSSQIYDLIDTMLQYERDFLKMTLTDATRLPIQFSSHPYLRVWRGDITTLIIDAIVNAGNSGLLGCFQPTHLCIDNVIHGAAGPRLRDDCYTIMNKQRRSEPVGHAKITSAYNLPSKYVLHTVGPEIVGNRSHVTQQDADALASCYVSCLDLAHETQKIQSIAFCCISTGLFAFPAEMACRIAIETVSKWFQKRPTNSLVSLIVFNVFTDQDEQFYTSVLRT